MYTIEFYENENNKGEITEYIRMLHESYKEQYYKMAAFLDYLSEKGSGLDKEVCRCPEGIVYMHSIEGMPELFPKRHMDSWSVRAGRSLFKGRRRFCQNTAVDEPAVCVILYGRQSREERSRDSFVILHHYFTNRVLGDLPLLQMFRAVYRLRKTYYYHNEH